MKTKPHSLKLAVIACMAMLAAVAARADFHVATSQDLQNALTLAAGNGANNIIWLTNGYYTGNFSYNSSATYSLTVQPEPGVANTNVTIDGGGGGRGLNIACSGASGNVTVSNITFLRNCGNYQIGALRIAASGGGTTIVDGCRFLSATNSSGMGLELASGLNTIIRNCVILGKTNAMNINDGDGINISGVTGSTLLFNNTIAGNRTGSGANITASAVLIVTNNVFLTNSYYGLYFNPSSGTKTAVVAVSNNVFSVNGYHGANINNFGLLNLGANVFNGNYQGGGYVASGNMAAVAGNTFYGNGIYNGWYGGIGLTYVTTVIVTGNAFNGNSGGYGGGGAYIYNYTSINTNVVTGNTFNGNSNQSGSGGGGAFVYGGANGCITTISNNTFGANTMYGPGGALSVSSSGTTTLAGNTFTGNSCSGNYAGGAVSINGGTNLVTGNMFTQNSAANGGGAIYVSCPLITISDNLIVYNSQSSAGATGGGIFVNASAVLYMINNTVFGNSSGGGGGGSSFQVNGSVELLNVFNNIIWGNTANGNGSDVYLTGSGLMKLFMYNDANGMYGVWNNALPQLNVDPKFFNPVNAIYGDYHLQTNSPCANYGTNGTFLPLTDLDGNTRTNSAGQVDLGCYEFNNTAAHPADTDTNFVITAAEYSAYAAAWKAGQSWTNGPNPISADYVTRAGYLMTNGGAYHNDGSARPVNWKVGP